MPAKFPTQGDLAVATLHALRKLGGSAHISEIATTVIAEERYADSIVDRPHKIGSQSELEYQLAWARTQLRAMGALARSERGVWSLTPVGWEIPNAVARNAPKQSRKSLGDSRHGSSSVDNDEAAQWRKDVIAHLVSLNPIAFEHFATRILREAGFSAVTVTSPSNDQGIDGFGSYRISLLTFTVAFQCKRYSKPVQATHVRNFRGSIDGRCSQGLLITTSRFTRGAREEATRDGVKPIDLIDGDRLCDLIAEYQLGVTTEMRPEMVVDDSWFSTLA